MSALAIVTIVILLLSVIALVVLNFKIIPDLAKNNPEDIEGNLKKALMYSKIYLGLMITIGVCVVLLLILGIARLVSGGSQPNAEEINRSYTAPRGMYTVQQ
jgi:hypothetical protein